ncbi:MAG: transcriptional regulator [Spirochaetaceae bacterium]|jgi:hypothetical protein|nr:transcriptional regulator [Spirochaetaceae bacterium]
MTDAHKVQAEEDFFRARGKAILSEIQHFLNADRNNLLSLNDVKEILKPQNEIYRGMQVVPIRLIVGSEGRYRDFNKYFLPKSDHLKSRWIRVDEARLKDIILPPIQLYEIGGVYFVRDGNHRVSVAKSQGVENIDAEVISLSSEISITPSMTTEKLREAVISFEKKVFYEKTRYGELTGSYDLDFSDPGSYDVIYNHILVHKYYLNEGRREELPFEEALTSWYRNVYCPIIQIINDEKLCFNFPGRTASDLYVWIVKHWDDLKQKYGVYALDDAARDFNDRYGKPGGRFFSFLISLGKRLLKQWPR